MGRSLHLLAGLACLPSLAAAQAFNLDMDDALATFGAGVPSSTYGAAAGQTGIWHPIDNAALLGLGNYVTPPLADTSGTTTAVTASFDVVNGGDTFTLLSSDEPTCAGDDALLMEDIMYLVGVPYTITFSGLAPGNYAVYTYAMAPDSATLYSLVDVVGGTGGAQVVGGAFPATGHAQGVSYALHTVNVDSSGTLVIHVDEDQGTDDSLNGIQLVPGGSVSIGVNYCNPANPNSTGMPGAIAAYGSLLVADNNLELRSTGLPDGQFAYYLASRTQGFVANPNGSQGNLCVLGQIARFNRPGEVGAISGGEFSFMVPLNDVPEPPTLSVAILAGETWNFQGWHRDMGPMGPTSNFTNGIEITFQ